jgi:hypothetical protein
METQNKLSAGFFFLSLGVLITLITSVTAFLNLVFATLDKRFPDVLNASYQYGYSTYQYEGIRAALATLIIFFPVFLVVSHFWRKFSEKYMGSIDQIIRKWVIYIILFMASVVAVIDLVALVRYFISGEITTRFILKVLVVLVVALFVGGYYILELRGTKKIFGFSVGIGAAIKSSILVVLIILFSFSVMGSPAKQRSLRLDDRRVNDLQSIQYQVINYWRQKEKLPENLDTLTSPLSGYSLPVPPMFEKGEVYEYNVKSKLTFELCATFALPMPQGWQEYGGGVYPMAFDMKREASVAYPYPGYGINESWDHEAGRTCFERTIDKDMYPPYPKAL